jgi:hypothetical protein
MSSQVNLYSSSYFRTKYSENVVAMDRPGIVLKCSHPNPVSYNIGKLLIFRRLS